MKTRNAQCLCGNLKVTIQGEPKFSMVCHCKNCQRQTGAAFRYGVYFPETGVKVEGSEKSYQYPAESGRSIEAHFCQNCGATVYWKAGFAQGLTGIAGGCLTEHDFPAPRTSVWNQSRHAWIELPASWTHHQKQP